MSEDIEFLNTQQVAEMLGCSLPTARKLFKKPDFPVIKVGKNYRILKSAFIEWCSQNRI